MRCLLAKVVSLAPGVEFGDCYRGRPHGDKCSDLQLDVSSTAQDRRFLTSIVMLPSDFGGFMGPGYYDSGDLTKRQYLLVWLLH